MTVKMKYRPDIDGLRAIAVLAVLFFHAEVSVFSGGYVGVDVFFVISGYLITTKIAQGIQTGTFSFITFYEQRIRRIFPALFAVIISTLLIGGWLFDAESYTELGESSVATTLSLANIFFWMQAGYFDKPSVLKPLLHTWSLSIEEQFYLILPLALVLLFRFFRSRVLLALIILFTVSLALSIYILPRDADATFYLLQYRAWELLLGSFFALNPFRLKYWQRNILSFAGICMILTAIITFSGKTSFPGFAALLPVVGAALIIQSGIDGTSYVGKILGARPFVFIGKISYSLYLWHWPLIAFGKYYLIRETTAMDIIVWLLVTFILSTLSWKFIETPFRSKDFLKRPRIFYYAGSITALTLSFGFAIYFSQGFPLRFTNSQASVPPESEWNFEDEGWYKCYGNRTNSYEFDFSQISELCSLGVGEHAPSFLLWGDSHARSLASAVNASALEAGKTGYLVSMTGCSALLGIKVNDVKQCYQHNNLVISYLEAHPEIETIILISRLSLYATGDLYTIGTSKFWALEAMGVDANVGNANADLFELGLQRTVDKLTKMKREVIIVLGVPEVKYAVLPALHIALRTGRDLNEIIGPTLEEYKERNAHVIPVIEYLERNSKNVKVLDPRILLCDDEKCKLAENNIPLYADNSHLTTFGAYYISSLFDPVFETRARKEK
jgi:peptidoglycan/LPS O-acetylase OafA/YrhL